MCNCNTKNNKSEINTFKFHLFMLSSNGKNFSVGEFGKIANYKDLELESQN